MSKLIYLTFIVVIAFQSANAEEIRHLRPPLLEQSNLGKKIVCLRPVRRKSPRISLERASDKIIIHNYGHGGAGWSLSYGSAKHTVDKLIKEFPDINRSQKIAIVGAGCMGLLTAYCLIEEGFTKIIIYAESFKNLTSHHAGGLLSFRATYNDPKLNTFITMLAVDTYNFYKRISLKKNKDFIGGAKLIPTYFEDLQTSELEAFVGKGMQPAKQVLVKFGKGISHTMIVYDDSIFIDTGKMMDALHKKLSNKTIMHTQKVTCLSKLSEKFIFNCTGLGSQTLQDDDSLQPITGHLLMLKNQKDRDLNYMLIVDFPAQSDDKKGVVRTLDFFPKRLPSTDKEDVGVLGGTFFKYSGAIEFHEKEFDFIIERAKNFFYGIKLNAKT